MSIKKEKGRFTPQNRPIMNTKKAVMNTAMNKEPLFKKKQPQNAENRTFWGRIKLVEMTGFEN